MFSSTEQIQPSDPPKNAILAAILSLILLGGVGQIYLGQTKKGAMPIRWQKVKPLAICNGSGRVKERRLNNFPNRLCVIAMSFRPAGEIPE